MNEHLQRALIEIFYAMAECDQTQAVAQADPRLGDMRDALTMVRASLEGILSLDLDRVEPLGRA